MSGLADFKESFRRLLASRGLWTPREQPAATAGEDPPPPSAPTPDTPDIDDPAFAQRLVAILRRHDSSAAGSLHVIGLRRVRERYAKRWPQVAERVHELVRAIIDRRLGRDDLCGRIDDHAYVLVLPRLTPDLARVKCAMIAEEIARRLLGEYESSGAVQLATATVRRGGDVSLETFDPAELLRSLGSTMEVGERQPGASDTPGTTAAPTGRTAAGDPEEGAADGGPQWVPGEHKSYNAWRPIEPDHPTLAPFLHPDGSAAQERTLHVRYRPIWHPRSGRIVSNLCVLAMRDPGGQLLTGGEALPTRAETSDNADLDTLPLTSLAHYLSQSDGAVTAVLPVHFATIAVARRRAAFFGAFGGLNENIRRRIDIELLGIHDDTPQVREAEAVAFLVPLCRRVQFRVRLESTFMGRFVGQRIDAVGADLSRIPKPEAEVIDLMRTFARRTKHLGFETFVHGARSRTMTLAAVANGFHYVDGDEIMTLAASPTPPTAFAIDGSHGPLREGRTPAAGG